MSEIIEYPTEYLDWKDFVLRDREVIFPCHFSTFNIVFFSLKDIDIIKDHMDKDAYELFSIIKNKCYVGKEFNRSVINLINFQLKPMNATIDSIDDIEELKSLVDKDLNEIIDEIIINIHENLLKEFINLKEKQSIYLKLEYFINLSTNLDKIEEDLENGHFKDGNVYKVNRKFYNLKLVGYICNRKFYKLEK